MQHWKIGRSLVMRGYLLGLRGVLLLIISSSPIVNFMSYYIAGGGGTSAPKASPLRSTPCNLRHGVISEDVTYIYVHTQHSIKILKEARSNWCISVRSNWCHNNFNKQWHDMQVLSTSKVCWLSKHFRILCLMLLGCTHLHDSHDPLPLLLSGIHSSGIVSTSMDYEDGSLRCILMDHKMIMIPNTRLWNTTE